MVTSSGTRVMFQSAARTSAAASGSLAMLASATGRDVAGGQRRAAHDGDLLHQPGQLRFQPQGLGDVGERADGQDPQRAGVLVGEPHQHLRRGLGRQLSAAVESETSPMPLAPWTCGAPPWNVPACGSWAPSGDGDVRVPGELEQVQGVPGADGGTDVAADGADPPHVRLRGGEQVGQGEGVVDAGVAVEVERVAGGRGHCGGSRFVGAGFGVGCQRDSPLGAATKRLTMNAAAVMATEIQSAVA